MIDAAGHRKLNPDTGRGRRMDGICEYLRRVFAVLVIASCLMPAVAAGDESGGGIDEEAIEYFDRGAELFHEGRYGAALTEFRRAYGIEPHPMIRYNMALAHLRLGNLEDARQMVRELAEAGTLPPDEATRNAARLDALDVALRARDVGDDIMDRMDETDGEELTVDAPPPRDETSRFGKLGTTSLLVSTAGMSMLAYAAIVDYRLDGKIDEYERAAEEEDLQRYLVLRDEIDDATRNGRIALYTGAGLLSVGLAMLTVDRFFYDRSSPREKSALHLQSSFIPGGDERGAILLLRGSF